MCIDRLEVLILSFPVSEAMVQEVVTFSEHEAREEVERIVRETRHHGFPVLRLDESGRTYMVMINTTSSVCFCKMVV